MSEHSHKFEFPGTKKMQGDSSINELIIIFVSWWRSAYESLKTSSGPTISVEGVCYEEHEYKK